MLRINYIRKQLTPLGSVERGGRQAVAARRLAASALHQLPAFIAFTGRFVLNQAIVEFDAGSAIPEALAPTEPWTHHALPPLLAVHRRVVVLQNLVVLS